MKTKVELAAIKEEVETLNKKLAELSEEELEQVSGGQQHIPNVFNTLNNANRHAKALAEKMERITTGQRIIPEKDNPISGAIGKHIEELRQALDRKLNDLTEEELKYVTCGIAQSSEGLFVDPDGDIPVFREPDRRDSN